MASRDASPDQHQASSGSLRTRGFTGTCLHWTARAVHVGESARVPPGGSRRVGCIRRLGGTRVTQLHRPDHRAGRCRLQAVVGLPFRVPQCPHDPSGSGSPRVHFDAGAEVGAAIHQVLACPGIRAAVPRVPRDRPVRRLAVRRCPYRVVSMTAVERCAVPLATCLPAFTARKIQSRSCCPTPAAHRQPFRPQAAVGGSRCWAALCAVKREP